MIKIVHEDRGQDLVEYSLLLAFVVMAAAGLFITNTASMTNIWAQANTQMSRAASASKP